jgi:Holliday junction resolvasome RuvABC endonuclease subunit
VLELAAEGGVKLLGCDPGLASFGLAIMSLEPRPRVVQLEVLRTERNVERRRLRVADDTCDRSRRLAHTLLARLDEHPDVIAICVEAWQGTYGKIPHQVVGGLGRVRGILDTLAELHELPIIEEPPQTLKRLVTGNRKASKEEVRDTLENRFPELAGLWPSQKTLQEHAGDAVATCVAGLESDIVRAALRGRGAA